MLYVGPFLFVSELFMSPVLIVDMRRLLSKLKETQCCKCDNIDAPTRFNILFSLFLLNLNAPCHVHTTFLH